MNNMKKLLLLFACAFAFASPFLAQKAAAKINMSDAAFAGLKGKVQTIVQESEWTYTPPSGPAETKRQKTSEWKFDPHGKLIEYIDYAVGYKELYADIDGFKTYKTEFFDVPGVYRGPVAAPFGRGDLSEKPRDTRFSARFDYKYDPKRRVSEEIKYMNNGELLSRTVYSYDRRGRIAMSKSYYNDILRAVSNNYYDEQGNLFLSTRENPGDRGVTNRTIQKYSDYRLDRHGNWTHRTELTFSTVDQGLNEIVIKRYRTITYY